MQLQDKRWFSHKSIGSILAFENHFDFENYNDDSFSRIFETTSSKIETYLPILLNELKSSELSLKGEAILAQYISNLYVRTAQFDRMIENLEKMGGFEKFIDECLYYNDKEDQEIFLKMIKDPFFKSKKNISNLSRVLFWNYFWHRLASFEYYILSPFPGKYWLTCDNPVVILKNISDYSVLGVDSEIVFPFNGEFLFVLKMEEAGEASRFFDNASWKNMTVATSEITDELVGIISSNADDIIVFSGMEDAREF